MLKASGDWFWKGLEQRPNRNIACCSSGHIKHTLFPEGLPGTPGDTLDFWRNHFQTENECLSCCLLSTFIVSKECIHCLFFCYSGEFERCCSYRLVYWCVESELSTLEPVTCWSLWVGSFPRACSFKWNQPLQIMTTQLFSWESFESGNWDFCSACSCLAMACLLCSDPGTLVCSCGGISVKRLRFSGQTSGPLNLAYVATSDPLTTTPIAMYEVGACINS